MRRFAPIPLLVLPAMAAAYAQKAPQAKQAPVRESVTVTATDRGLAGVNDSATSAAVLPLEQMQAAPGLALDDALHQVAGFQLFRRTSSWTANPTTEGVSLRGLGSTAASRTLVVSDQVPLNDAFGGWVHWNEVPALAIRQVELVRGGSSDLYGSSAMGGVVNLVPETAPVAPGLHVAADALGAAENTGSGDALVSGAGRRVGALGALSVLSTGGYVPTAPAFRGAVDVPSNVSDQAARVEVRGRIVAGLSGFLRGNLLNEARQNGTPLQTNGTRLWRYAAGADAERANTTASLRVFGSREAYRQSFSSIAADRNSEKLSRLQRVPTDEFGFAAMGSHLFGHALSAAADVDLRDVRATDAESPVSTVTGAMGATTAISARQREAGGFVDALWQPKGWSVSGSVRVDSFRTFDGRSVTGGAATAEPEVSELVASPRLGVVREVGHGFALTATAFRAFRGPTMNELYRTGQVGQQVTLANANLLAERATGWEAGGEWTRAGLGHVRAVYFWTEVNRPISAVLLSQSSSGAQTLQRQNLGQIRSRGVMVEAQTETQHGFDASVGYQLAVATVTAFNTASAVQANLTGKWIPEVPRQSLTAAVNYAAPRVATFHVIESYQGQEFDDAANQYLLHPYARFDVSAERTLGRGLSLWAGAQNVLDRAIQAGRTPVLTLAAPRLVEGGVRWSF